MIADGGPGATVTDDEVELMVTGGPELRQAWARVIAQEGDAVTVEVTEGVLYPDDRILFGGETWTRGRVTSTDGSVAHIELVANQARDKRDFPRMHGGIDLTYQVSDGAEGREALWMRGGIAPSLEWTTPDPFMEFSGSGLRFRSSSGLRPGQVLLLQMVVPTHAEGYRLTALVIRVDEIPVEDRDDEPFAEGAYVPTHQVAVQFEAVPEGAVEALMEFTARLQSAFFN